MLTTILDFSIHILFILPFFVLGVNHKKLICGVLYFILFCRTPSWVARCRPLAENAKTTTSLWPPLLILQ